MSDTAVSRLEQKDLEEFKKFCLEAWGAPHALIHDETSFEYYYRAADGSLNFALARDDSGEILSVCGYILSNSTGNPDAWISFLVSKKGAPFGLAYRLFDFIIETTRCRTIGCNNIREKTRGLYEFRGWSVETLSHYYRLNPALNEYTLCKLATIDIPSVEHSAIEAKRITDERGLEPFEKTVLPENLPYKDRLYLERRYFNNPWFAYEAAGIFDGGEPVALVFYRQIDAEGTAVLRVVDFIGDTRALPAAGEYLDRQMRERSAEYCDWYAYGLKEADMRRAGFALRARGGENIVPNYLEPPLCENTDFFFFTSELEGYRVFKADGDQDRPNLQL